MKKAFGYLGVAGLALVAAAPAQATVLLAGSTTTTFSAFDATTRGTQLVTLSQSGTAPTISGTFLSAVYRNTMGTLDFYFQVFRTGGVNMIDAFNVGGYTGLTIDALVDGTGTSSPFVATNNGTTGSTTTVGRTVDGGVVRVDFGTNGLDGTENSAAYVLRTNATSYAGGAFATVSNSTAFNVITFTPTAAVPEPATWAMMLVGFGMIGAVSRYRRRSTKVVYA